MPKKRPTKLQYQRELEKAFSYPSYYYLSFQLLEGDLLTPAEQRAELKHLLSVARSRQVLLRKSEFANSPRAKQNLPKLSMLKNDRDVSNALAEVATFISSRRSTVEGARMYREDVMSTLNRTFAEDSEVDFSDPNFNWKAFGRYMQDMRRLGKTNEGGDSERAVRMYFIAKGTGLTPAGLRDNYEEFLARQDELKALYENNPYGRRNISGEHMLQRLDELKNK